MLIIIPFLSLGFVTSSPTALWWFNSIYDVNRGGTTVKAYIDEIPIWSCRPYGYLAGGPWTFLGIDMQFGRMSFAQAKTLDMAWNWVAGRGLQFLLAWLTYHVFTSALMRTAELTHVPYGLFSSLALYSARPGCLWDIAKGLLTIRGLRIKFIMAWLPFSTVYLAAFPSLLDVMSGYEGFIRTELIMPNKTTLDLTAVLTLENILYYLPGCDVTENRTCDVAETNYNFYDRDLNTTWHAFFDWQTYANTSVDMFYTEEAETTIVLQSRMYISGVSRGNGSLSSFVSTVSGSMGCGYYG